MNRRIALIQIFAAIPLLFSTQSSASNLTREEASGACMLFIKQLLHDPDSAKFGHSKEATVSLNGNKATVIREVRATNAFGAKRLSEFKCIMEKRGGSIHPISVKQTQ